MEFTLIGIDCATEAAKVGIARAVTNDGQTRVTDVEIGGKSMVQTLLGWIHAPGPVLVALDAPLGWPAEMGPTLCAHRAGSRISTAKDVIFRRETDRVVHLRIGKLPLEVGANLIARTAHAALDFLDTLRQGSGEELPLVWTAGAPRQSVAIEVYPAATLKAHGIQVGGYKGKEAADVERRLEILEHVSGVIELPKIEPIAKSPDMVDAVLCVLTAHDFLYDEVLEPDDRSVAEKEGWIWVKRLG